MHRPETSPNGTPEPVEPGSAAGESAALPQDGRLLGIDYGVKRLGLALSTPEQNLSTPLETLVRHGQAADARRISELIADYRIVGCVVGLPLHMNGDEGQSARQARDFGRWLGETVGLPVVFWDERCSSAAADDWMIAADLSRHKRRGLRDQLAAHVILESFLAARARKSSRPSEDE